MMRKVLVIFAFMAVLLTSCRKDDENYSGEIVGSWCLIEDGALPTTSLSDISVYVKFGSDYSFRLYQRLGADRYQAFTGTYSVADNILSGRYSDGTSFGTEYQIDFEADHYVLVMTPQNKSKEITRFQRGEIPSTVLNNIYETRSASSPRSEQD